VKYGVAASRCGAGAALRTDGIMGKEDDVEILKQHLETSAWNRSPNTTSRLAPKRLKD